MINFIIVDDNNSFLSYISSIIDKIMMKTNYEYNKKIFGEYDNKFNEYSNQNLDNKIYILDIITKENNGVDIAREIRKKNREATIIFLTAYEQYGNEILKSMIEAFSFICKSDDIEEILEQNIMEILDRIDKNNDIIKIENFTSLYAIPISKILYITKDSKHRKSIIRTDSNKIYCNRTLKSLEQEYPNNLIRTHKSCIVNIKRIIKFEFKEHRILFDNKNCINLLSKKYKDKIKEKFFRN